MAMQKMTKSTYIQMIQTSRKPVITIQRPWSMQVCTMPGLNSHSAPPRVSSAVWKVKNFTARPEEEMPVGTPRFFRANTYMGWPPVAAGVTLE